VSNTLAYNTEEQIPKIILKRSVPITSAEILKKWLKICHAFLRFKETISSLPELGAAQSKIQSLKID
jgi:hypothetical protein